MMMLPSGVKVHIAAGVTDMRKGMDGLAMLVQGVLRADPFSGHLFAFRGRKANLIKKTAISQVPNPLSGKQYRPNLRARKPGTISPMFSPP